MNEQETAPPRRLFDTHLLPARRDRAARLGFAGGADFLKTSTGKAAVNATPEAAATLLEAIKDPLTHLVRNAIDHGIEMPEVRRQAGKNEKGKLWVRVEPRGTRIAVVVGCGVVLLVAQVVGHELVLHLVLEPPPQLEGRARVGQGHRGERDAPLFRRAKPRASSPVMNPYASRKASKLSIVKSILYQLYSSANARTRSWIRRPVGIPERG